MATVARIIALKDNDFKNPARIREEMEKAGYSILHETPRSFTVTRNDVTDKEKYGEQIKELTKSLKQECVDDQDNIISYLPRMPKML